MFGVRGWAEASAARTRHANAKSAVRMVATSMHRMNERERRRKLKREGRRGEALEKRGHGGGMPSPSVL